MTNKRVHRLALAILAASALHAARAGAQETVSSSVATTMDMPVVAAGSHVMITPDECVWKDGPPSLPPGAKVAALEGDMAAAGPFTVRAILPAGYRIPAHFHPADEHVTVLSGSLHMGLGDKLDTSKGRVLPRGGFAVMPAGVHHFAWTDEKTELQIHGVGPWGITYIDPATDPRNATK
jgi:mannose-6-phosphate isomerase-like protein (cupin superfamily)